MATWNLDKLRVTKSVKIGADLLCVARTPNSEQLWIGSNDFRIYALDLSAEKPQPVPLAGHQSYVSGVVLVGKTLISGSWDRKLIWWDLAKRRPIRTVDAHERWIRQLAIRPDQRQVASIADDMRCRLWDVDSGRLIREFQGHEPRLTRYDYPNKLYACAFSPDGKFIAAADEMCQILVWEAASGKLAVRLDARGFYKLDWDRNNHPYGGVRVLAFSPDGQSLAVGGMQNTDVAIINGPGLVQVYDWKAGKLTHELKNGSNLQYETLWFHPHGDWLVALVGGAQQKTSMTFFDLKQRRLLKDVTTPAPSFGLAVNEKFDALYTVGRGLVAKWECPA